MDNIFDINSLNENEFMDLCNEFNSLNIYKDKLDFVYERFGKVWGADSKEINGEVYTLSISPQNDEQNLERWNYLFNKEQEKYFRIYYNKIIEKLNSCEDDEKEVFLKNHLKEIIKRVKESGIEYGYEMGTMKKDLNYLNTRPIISNNTDDVISNAHGFALYRLERKLKQISIEKADNIDEFGISFTKDRHRLVMLDQLGILDHLITLFEIPKNQPSRLAKLVNAIFGIERESNRYETVYDDIKKYFSGDKSPVNEESKKIVIGELQKNGFDIKKLK